MAFEIEHKYIVTGSEYKEMSTERVRIRQGYLCKEPSRTVRVRTWNETGFITIKGMTKGDTREEFEYEIPYDDAVRLLGMCVGTLLDKERYIVEYKGFVWEVDEFHGTREGLCLAEVELPSSETVYDLPPFVGRNVTGDPAYYNSNL